MPKQGQIVDTTYSGGRGVFECWSELFAANEKHWNSGAVTKILTDPELVAKMREWFPNRASLVAKVSRVRGEYNRRKRFIASFRYMRDGGGTVCRATARGLPISEWKSPGKKPAY